MIDFLEIYPKETNYTLYDNQTCTNTLTTFSSDAKARAKNVPVTNLNPTNINYFWIKAEGEIKCRRLNFAYKMTDPCAGLPGGEWVWVPPLSDGIGDGLGVRASQVGFTNPKGLCVTKYIVSADDSDPACASVLQYTDAGVYEDSEELNYYEKNLCKPISSSSKGPWLKIYSYYLGNTICQSLDTINPINSTKYKILYNSERMTIALNAEADYRNWSNQIGFDGTAKLNKGHSDTTTSTDTYWGPKTADEGECLLGNSQCTLDPVTNWHENRRTFYVKNGLQGNDVIWDLAGNVRIRFQWSESIWNLSDGYEALQPTNENDYYWLEWSANAYSDGYTMTKNTSLPQNVLNGNTQTSAPSTFNLGMYYFYPHTDYPEPFVGSNWNDTTHAGLFTFFSSSYGLNYNYNTTGLVCIYRP